MRRIDGQSAVKELYPEILTDESRFFLGTPRAVCFPESKEDILGLLTEANSDMTPFCLAGARTGITGGSVPADNTITLVFSSFNKILRVEMNNCVPVLFCEPGVTLEEISRFLANPSTWPYPVPGQILLEQGDYFYGPDPTEMSAQLGGTIATNASGARSFRLGSTRDHIEFLEIILANGDTLELRRGENHAKGNHLSFTGKSGTAYSINFDDYCSPDIKNASGYYLKPGMDAIDLFIGSEGTLGIICSVGIRLKKSLQIKAGLTFFPSRTAAFDFADFVRDQTSVLSIEYFDTSALDLLTHHKERLQEKIGDIPEGKVCAVYWEFIETNPDAFENTYNEWETALNACGTSFDHTWSGFDKTERTKLKQFRHAVPEIVNSLIASHKASFPAIRKISTDTALPASHFRSLFEKCLHEISANLISYVAFGHLGDFHIHINMIPTNLKELEKSIAIYNNFMKMTIACGGTVSAEHGIGKLKRKYLQEMCGEKGIACMKQTKQILDPYGLLNPGNLF